MVDVALMNFMEALGCRAAAVRRDECGDWRIEGSRGYVYAVSGTLHRPSCVGFMVYCAPGSARAWSAAKTAMGFTKVLQDGDDEGLLFLDRLPTPEEAIPLRANLRIAKRRVVSETERLRLAEIGRATTFVPQNGVDAGFHAQGTTSNDTPGSRPS
jgi:hypothetical protein